ncbi:tetratricopeptide repeat protein [Acidithiobacillus sp. AMEEHan]|uniref:tetratricopeptide repeat protein n=1 Tax=Acidithiobacillus sp. AMEEHan TaxID=2994951 RepID=UPI0027E4EBE1|nr:tetratricopeptide repeat protein [Acidithiobacillus sp. AMEEHan]
MKIRALAISFVLAWCALPALAASMPSDWWKAPGSLASDDAEWRAKYLQQKEVANAFAADLQASQKSGKGMSYLDQGGVSPSWYRPPLEVQPYPAKYSQKLYDLAYSAFLQSHELDEAYRLAFTAVQKRPDDRLWRQRLIEVAGWLGQREEVLRQLHWLAEHGDATAQAKAISLALTLERPDIVISMLAPAAHSRPLSDAEWKSLIYAYGQLGEPDRALKALDYALQRFGPRRYLLNQKAYLSYQMGDIEASLHALQRSAGQYGSDPSIAIEEARLLSMQGNYRLAFAALERVRAQATLEEVPFWQLYAVLAWELHDHDAALQAEKTLYLLGAANQYDLQRLVRLTGEKEPEAALSVAMLGWRKYHLPIFYFEGLYYAAAAKHWETLGQLLQEVAKSDPDGLRNFPAYWLALGQWANARLDYHLAGYAYAEALRRNPDDTVAENNLLWMLIDSGQLRLLRAVLVGNTAQPESALRDAVRNALERLNLNRQALYLPRDLAKVAPSARAPRLLNEASLWDSTGQTGLAWSLRRQAAWQSAQELRDMDGGDR